MEEQNKTKKSDYKDLLESLQQESWQLELLISGFAILGLFQIKSYVFSSYSSFSDDATLLTIPLIILSMSFVFGWYFLLLI